MFEYCGYKFQQTLTKETTLLVMTPPNRVFTVFFWKKQNTHCCISRVNQDAGKGGFCRGRYYELLRHLLNLGDEVSEELCHVLLLASVQRLLVHRVGLAERSRVVGLPLTFLHTSETRWQQLGLKHMQLQDCTLSKGGADQEG